MFQSKPIKKRTLYTMCRGARCTRSMVSVRVLHFCIFLGVEIGNILLAFIPFYDDHRTYFWATCPAWCVFSLLWLWSYIHACWLDSGSVEGELEKRGLLVNGELQELPPGIADLPRCAKCNMPKPERAHHCGVCNRCYLRWDHHCPVIGNCVALKNMKAFMLFLFYTCILVILSAVNAMMAYIVAGTLHVMIAYLILFAGFFVSASVGCFGCQYVPEVCVNRTTIEKIAGNDEHVYDEGKQKNIEQVFGEIPLLWFFPTPPRVKDFDIANYNVSHDNPGSTI